MRVVRMEISVLRMTPRRKRALSHGTLVYGQADDLLGKPVLLRVVDESGAAGVAQMRPLNPWVGETTESVVGALRDYFAPIVLGEDPRERNLLYGRLAEALPGTPVALCILDCALHDLMGKLTEQPVAVLLGGSVRTPLPMEWSVGLADPAAMIEEARAAVAQHGVRVVCLKVGPRERWKSDVEVFEGVRDALGDDVEIGIDANEGYDESTTVRVLKAIRATGPAYVEQPLPRDDHAGLARLRLKVDPPILVDESVFTPQQAYQVARAGACDTIVLKLYKNGGITGALRVADVALGAGISVNVGGTAQGSQLEAAAAAHLTAGLTNHVFASEFIMGLSVVETDPLLPEPIVDFEAGVSHLHDAPGFGAPELDAEDIDRCALAQYAVEAD